MYYINRTAQDLVEKYAHAAKNMLHAAHIFLLAVHANLACSVNSLPYAHLTISFLVVAIPVVC